MHRKFVECLLLFTREPLVFPHNKYVKLRTCESKSLPVIFAWTRNLASDVNARAKTEVLENRIVRLRQEKLIGV